MGLIRFYLALSVVTFHASILLRKEFKLPWNKDLFLGMDGWHAVFLFYVISGFLISFVLEIKYPRGKTSAFYQARFYRIYPLWWAVCLFSIFMWGGGGLTRHGILPMLSVWILFGLDWLLPFLSYPKIDWSFLPPYTLMGWTLGAEVMFYALAPFLLRAPKIAAVAFVGSLTLRMIAWTTADGFDAEMRWNFYFFPTALSFFLAGHFAREICKLRPELLSYGFWLAIPAILCIYNMPAIPFDSVYFYFGTLLFALALPSIFEATKDNRISNFFGDLTYPIYLIHIFCIIAAAGLLRTSSGSAFLDYVRQIPSTSVQSYAWMLPFLVACTVMAGLVHYLVEIPLVAVLRLAFSGLRNLGMSAAKRAA
ncbi:acyltransferase family protein [Methyloceanibacter sp.]|uniref:acyltransferase family protein n=1 Tax=Methyloceanibacter sp. TaxID=1965321 RepID=UPI003D6D6BC8